MKIKIRAMTDSDWDAVRAIYLAGIATGNATFETSAPTKEVWNASHLPHSRFVAERGGEVVGWAALSGVSDRCVYGGVAEVSVYVGERGRGAGIGSALLAALIESSEANGLWMLQAGIFRENESSRGIHLKHGFREIGFRERVGKHHGVWRDTILLERRSSAVGVD